MKKILKGIILVSILFPLTIRAECGTDEKIALFKMVGNVKVTPIFKEETESFDIIISNITPSIYFKDMNENITYKNTGSEVTLYNKKPNQSYRFKFFSASPNCYGSSINSTYITLPSYNKYYKDPLCEGLSEYEMCKKWTSYNKDRETFEKEISKIEKKEIIKVKKDPGIETVKGFYDYLGEIYEKYYYIILPIIIVGCIITIVRLRKKEDFF